MNISVGYYKMPDIWCGSPIAQLVVEGIVHHSLLRSIELLGTQVAPAVRAALGMPQQVA